MCLLYLIWKYNFSTLLLTGKALHDKKSIQYYVLSNIGFQPKFDKLSKLFFKICLLLKRNIAPIILLKRKNIIDNYWKQVLMTMACRTYNFNIILDKRTCSGNNIFSYTAQSL